MCATMRTPLTRARAAAFAVVGLCVVGSAGRIQARQSAAGAAGREATQRLQRIEDRAEIEQLLLNYGRYLDARDFKAYSLLFARDGVWEGGMGTVQGPAAIQTFMEKAIPGPNKAHNFHLLSNFVIDVQGESATAWSRWQFIVPGQDGKPVVAQAGRYDDTLVREDGRWKFKRRVAANDLPLPRQASPN
jgi:ketosteroid isomerase-like protein